MILTTDFPPNFAHSISENPMCAVIALPKHSSFSLKQMISLSNNVSFIQLDCTISSL
jgi:hypothetical protein